MKLFSAESEKMDKALERSCISSSFLLTLFWQRNGFDYIQDCLLVVMIGGWKYEANVERIKKEMDYFLHYLII